jgi:cardiolipin synthase
MSQFWKSEQIFFNGDDYFESLSQDINRATNFISIEMYIFNDDALGKKIATQLIMAKERGVKIQIIVDGIGSYSFFNRLYDFFIKKGIQIKIFNPLPFYHPYFGRISFLKKLYVLGARLWKINRRNHRKIITIDHKVMYTGSFNITAEHTTLHSENPWLDLGLRVEGDHVQFAVLNFKKVWKIRDYFKFKRQYKQNLKLNWRQSPLRLNQTIFMKRFFYKNFIQRVQKAQKRIWLMTPYFIPKRRLIRALGKAAQRGIDVRIIISQKTDVKFFKWLQYFYYDYLLKKGAKVYQYTDSVLHAKNYIIDDFMTIGSTNLNHRSFIHDLEVDMEIQETSNKYKIVEHFQNSSLTQKEITLEGLRQRPLLDRFLSRIFFLIKYWS